MRKQSSAKQEIFVKTGSGPIALAQVRYVTDDDEINEMASAPPMVHGDTNMYDRIPRTLEDMYTMVTSRGIVPPHVYDTYWKHIPEVRLATRFSILGVKPTIERAVSAEIAQWVAPVEMKQHAILQRMIEGDTSVHTMPFETRPRNFDALLESLPSVASQKLAMQWISVRVLAGCGIIYNMGTNEWHAAVTPLEIDLCLRCFPGKGYEIQDIDIDPHAYDTDAFGVMSRHPSFRHFRQSVDHSPEVTHPGGRTLLLARKLKLGRKTAYVIDPTVRRHEDNRITWFPYPIGNIAGLSLGDDGEDVDNPTWFSLAAFFPAMSYLVKPSSVNYDLCVHPIMRWSDEHQICRVSTEPYQTALTVVVPF